VASRSCAARGAPPKVDPRHSDEVIVIDETSDDAEWVVIPNQTRRLRRSRLRELEDEE
jgi:hypothetical protein